MATEARSCAFATGSYGEIDLFTASPSGIVTMKPAVSAAVTNIAFNINGVHNLLITGFTGTSFIGDFLINRAGASDSTNITLSGNEVKSIWVG
jgi:hypothetical protein